MQRVWSVATIGISAAVLMLVAHLWMFDVQMGDAPEFDLGASVSASAASFPVGMAGCASGMSTCQVPMPSDGLATLALLVLGGVALAAALSPPVLLDQEDGGQPAYPERAPPRSCVPPSVVLLV